MIFLLRFRDEVELNVRTDRVRNEEKIGKAMISKREELAVTLVSRNKQSSDIQQDK